MSTYRTMLKEATTLKRAKRYDEACGKLREAYGFIGNEYSTISEILRLPAYLQLAGRESEALREFDDLLCKYKYIKQSDSAIKVTTGSDGSISMGVNFSLNTGTLSVIHASIAKFHGGYGRYREQLLHLAISYVFNVVSDIEMIQSMHDMSDYYYIEIKQLSDNHPELMESNLRFEAYRSENYKTHAYTAKGNPVQHVSYPIIKDRVLKNISIRNIFNEISPTFAKAGLSNMQCRKIVKLVVNSIDKADLQSEDWINDIKNLISNG